MDDRVLARVAAAIEARKTAAPDASYVASLLHKGDNAILKKIGEEATETVMAAKDGDKLSLVHEVADLRGPQVPHVVAGEPPDRGPTPVLPQRRGLGRDRHAIAEAGEDEPAVLGDPTRHGER